VSPAPTPPVKVSALVAVLELPVLLVTRNGAPRVVQPVTLGERAMFGLVSPTLTVRPLAPPLTMPSGLLSPPLAVSPLPTVRPLVTMEETEGVGRVVLELRTGSRAPEPGDRMLGAPPDDLRRDTVGEDPDCARRSKVCAARTKTEGISP
jgi:hypothetical protein